MAHGYVISDDPGRLDLDWIWETLSAHSLYERFGFEKPGENAMVRPSRR